MAFLLSDYILLIETMLDQGYSLGPVKSYFKGTEPPFVFLRHDVDRFIRRAVKMAEAEHNIGVSSTYYFRCTRRNKFPAKAIKYISKLKHEIGYHYETVVRCRGDLDKARDAFQEEIATLRQLVDVKTIAAHGSPFSAYSNMGYTDKLNVQELGILGEPIVDYDFTKILYITDKGGMFGSRHNISDWSDGKNLKAPARPVDLLQILNPFSEAMVLINAHPERWPVTNLGLVQAVIMDQVVNFVKYLRNLGTES